MAPVAHVPPGHKHVGKDGRRRLIIVGALAVGLVLYLKLRGSSLFGTPTGVVATPDPTATTTDTSGGGTLGGTTSDAGNAAASDPNLIAALTGSIDTLTQTAQALQDQQTAFLQAQQSVTAAQTRPAPQTAPPQIVVFNPGGPGIPLDPFNPGGPGIPFDPFNPGGPGIPVQTPTSLAAVNPTIPPEPPPLATVAPVSAPVIVKTPGSAPTFEVPPKPSVVRAASTQAKMGRKLELAV